MGENGGFECLNEAVWYQSAWVGTVTSDGDRALRALHIWTPNWYKGSYTIAYWDVYGRPEQQPPYSRGDGYWWWDEAKAEKLRAEGAL